MTRLVICSSHDLVLFSGVSVVKDASYDDAPASTRRAILPVKDEPKAEQDADAPEVSETAPTLVPPRPSGVYALHLDVAKTGEPR